MAHYGLEGVFSVAKTEIDNLAAIASDEILFPEVARCLMMRGAEVFLHMTSEIYGRKERSPKDIAKMSRAMYGMQQATIIADHLEDAIVKGAIVHCGGEVETLDAVTTTALALGTGLSIISFFSVP